MAKPKSKKLRTIITLYALLKHTDKNHRMNAVKLNEFLRPYGLDSDGKTLSSTVKALREVGWDIRNKGEWDCQGIWVENRPLQEHELRQLIFAITTNPNISNAQINETLQYLKPFVTVYQEDLLKCQTDTEESFVDNECLYTAYAVIHEAIARRRRVRYTEERIKYDQEALSWVKTQGPVTFFTPKRLVRTKNGIYMVGFHHTSNRIDAVNLRGITSIRIAPQHREALSDAAHDAMTELVPKDFVMQKYGNIVYEGPVVFRCKGKCVKDLLRHFGEPERMTVQHAQLRTTYSISNAKVTANDLFWMSQMAAKGIRIAGPAAFQEAVYAFCAKLESMPMKYKK